MRLIFSIEETILLLGQQIFLTIYERVLLSSKKKKTSVSRQNLRQIYHCAGPENRSYREEESFDYHETSSLNKIGSHQKSVTAAKLFLPVLFRTATSADSKKAKDLGIKRMYIGESE